MISLWILEVSIYLLGVGFFPCAYRLIRGPSIGDRLLALDLMLILVMGVFTLLFIQEGHLFFLELGMIVALTAFVSTLAFCRAVLRRGQ
jgi:multisubunit Na+/H+ antiporter MnhF subunit